MREWAKVLGISEGSIEGRINRLGWSVEEALSTPAFKIGQKRPKPILERVEAEADQ